MYVYAYIYMCVSVFVMNERLLYIIVISNCYYY